VKDDNRFRRRAFHRRSKRTYPRGTGVCGHPLRHSGDGGGYWGGLSISAPTGSVDLGSVAASSNTQVVSNSIGTIRVTDTRAGTAGWVATVGATDFTGPQNISVSTPGSVTYAPGQATVTGTANVTPTNENHLYPTSPVQTATGVSGSNTAAWSPVIAVTIPASALIGQYSTTITHSVS
jgi:hypothetical protein